MALPFAVWVFLAEQRKERENEEEEAYQHLSDAYNAFLKVVLENADLQLRTQKGGRYRVQAPQIQLRQNVAVNAGAALYAAHVSASIAEGIERSGDCNWRDYLDHPYNDFTSARRSYRSLWDQINGPGSWDANPWVWVVEFKRIEGAPNA